ncbi:hypothetical protein ACIP9H_29455 [Streptomyces sp. NPDC088732]|uniref:hypothetical protein n=1 Tax=Streptomyces sp. NPDC088732 TaxID=3365879 RepID=UPI0038048EA3
MISCGLCEVANDNGYLCRGDALVLARHLELLPRIFHALGAFLAPGAAPVGERVSSSPAGSRMPVNEDVIDLRYGGMTITLERWRADVQAFRGWGQPAIEGDMERRLYAAVRWLGMELDWIAGNYPPAGDLAREVREIRRAGLSIIGALPDHGRRIGQCVAGFPDGSVCGAALWHRPEEKRIVCPWCQCIYEPRDFEMLRSLQPEGA